MKKMNFNHSVKVKLTERGKRIYREHYKRYGLYANVVVGYDGFSEFQLWNFMGIFGDEISKGHIILEDGCIYMYEKDIENV